MATPTKWRSRRQEQISDTVAVLMRRCDDTFTDLGASLKQDRTNISAKIRGRRLWTVDDLDGIAHHYGISILELLSGTQVAVDALPRERLAGAQGRQAALPAA